MSEPLSALMQRTRENLMHEPVMGSSLDAWIERAKSMESSIAELVEAMRKYEMDVDEDAPFTHREMMKRATISVCVMAKDEEDEHKEDDERESLWHSLNNDHFFMED